MKKIIFTFLILQLSSTYFSQALSDDTLHWTDYRKLSWNDFKGEAIDLPNVSGQEMVVLLANFKKVHLFIPTTTSVVAVFDRKNSWVNNPFKTEQLLRYYQITFDLYESYVRRLRKEFAATKFGLDPNKVFQEKYNAALTALSDRNKQFMKETKMGQDVKAMDEWAEMIKLELKELEAYRYVK